MPDKTPELSPERRRLLELMLQERAKEKKRRGHVEPRPEGEPLELSFAQRRLWFIQRLQPELAAYNIPSAVRLTGPLDADTLQRAVDGVVERHETLRTRFAFEEGRPVPVVAAPGEEGARIEIERHDLRSGVTGEEEHITEQLERRVQGRVDGLARRPFDLAAHQLLRLHLFRLGEEDHVLLVVMHHVISDTWTTGIFLREVTSLYAALLHGRPSPLPELPVQYTDYASWQRRLIRDEGLDGELTYWKDQLADAPQLLELPTDRPRPAVQSFRGGRQSLKLPRAKTDALKALAGEQDASLFMALLALYQLMLYRFTGQEDVLVGSPIANRDRVELEGMIGLFVNTLVLRTDLGGGPTFRQLLDRVREMSLGGFAHKELPFEKLVEELDLDRDTGRNPLFQVLFAFQNVPIPDLVAEGLHLERFEFRETTCRLDLELDLQEMPDGFVGWLGYNSDLFEPETVERMADAFHRLLDGVLAEPDRPVDELPLVEGDERRRVVAQWNDTATAYDDAGETLTALLARQAGATPDAVAALFAGAGDALAERTYADLFADASRLAHHLRSLGVGPESRVGVAAERSFELVEGLLAVLLAGGAYVPLDPGYPAERLEFMAGDADLAVLLTQSHLEADLPETGAEVVRLDADRGAWAELPAEPPVVDLSPENAAYVIYTSGSTGRPKGAVNSHRAIVNRLLWMQDAFGLQAGDGEAGDRVLQKTPFSFDVSVWEFFWPLVTGAGLVLAKPEGHKDPAYLASLIADAGVTTLHFVPSMLASFLPLDGLEESCRTVRRVICSGEALSRELVERFHQRMPETASLHNLYGPTEAAIDVTWWPAEAAGDESAVVPIGKPIANLRVHVLDHRGAPVPVGVAGELHIGGVGLARGYHHRPALTAERFVPDPLAGELADGFDAPGGRLYRTGDRARLLPSGDVEFLGRLDHQVKLRGYRIEIGEIEAVLAQHPAVKSAAAGVWGDASDRRLVAWVEAEAGEEVPSRSDLRVFLADLLPEYMVPSVFVPMDEMPVTANGKLDRRALPEPELGRPDDGAAFVEAASDLERTLAEMWQRILKVDRVGRNDDFFDLGGHSLLLTQVHQELATELAPDLDLVDLFQYRTVADLATFLAGDGGDAAQPVDASRDRGAARRAGGVEGSTDLAVVGMAVRVPGANDIATFWRNLREGVESISFFSEEEVLEAGVPPERLAHPDYVRAEGEVDDVAGFDAEFFGLSPREAEMMDPQQRHFLECAWEALEDAGYDPQRYAGSIGVFGGVNISSYLFNNLSDFDAVGAMSDFHTRADILIGNQPDFLTSRVSHQLGLGGPSVSVQTSCSSALVAVHTACQNLLARGCDMALAGGVQMRVPQRMGYLYREGGLPSPDGHCRSFDADAKGTVHGNGVGLVVLKRLDDALADGDHVYGVVKGTSVNNDAGTSVGYTAPSAEGLTRVAAEALAVAGVEPTSVGLVEANGTGTEMGDPIEFAGLARAYRAEGERNFCALGSVKTNIGHLDTASGVASLVKAVLAVRHGEIPALLHFRAPNANIDLASSPFHVNTELAPWPEGKTPRRAAVNNFGVGGTNAHAIVEEPPQAVSEPSGRPVQLLPLSARSTSGLHKATVRLGAALAGALEKDGDGFDRRIDDLADVAFTLQTGRRHFPVRRLVAAQDLADAGDALESQDPRRVATSFRAPAEVAPALVLPGAFPVAGEPASVVGLGRALYDGEPVFRTAVDEAVAALAQLPGGGIPDALELLYPEEGAVEAARSRVAEAGLGDALLVAVQHATLSLYTDWGVAPTALVAEGAGHLAAAVAAGVLPLAQALDVAVARGAATMSGDTAALTAALARLTPSPSTLPWTAAETGGPVGADTVSDPDFWTASGAPDEAGDTGLEAAVAALPDLGEGERLLLVIGPVGDSSSGAEDRGLDRPHAALAGARALPAWGADGDGAHRGALLTLGHLWLAGLEVDWQSFAAVEKRRRVPLPTYPFEHQTFWRQPKPKDTLAKPSLDRKLELDQWFHAPTWRRSEQPPGASGRAALEGRRWLVFHRGGGLGTAVVDGLTGAGAEVVPVLPGDGFGESEGGYRVRPGSPDDHSALMEALASDGVPERVVHLWAADGEAGSGEARATEQISREEKDGGASRPAGASASGGADAGSRAAEGVPHGEPGNGASRPDSEAGSEDDARAVERDSGSHPLVKAVDGAGATADRGATEGFESLVALARALDGSVAGRETSLAVVTAGGQEVTGGEELRPAVAPVLGAARVLPQEYPWLDVRAVDLDPATLESARTTRALLAELGRGS